MTLNNLRNIINMIDYEIKFGCLVDRDKKRFEIAAKNLKVVLNDRLGFPLYDEESSLKDVSGVEEE